MNKNSFLHLNWLLDMPWNVLTRFNLSYWRGLIYCFSLPLGRMVMFTMLLGCRVLQKPSHSCNISSCPHYNFPSWPSLSYVCIICFKFLAILMRPSLVGGDLPNLEINLFFIIWCFKPLRFRLHKNILWLRVN